MKWFKHYSNASNNDKLGKLEDQFGLVGYAAYFKILELCASNWDEISDPVFSFSSKQIQNKLRMKSKQTDLVLGLLSELNLFQISKCENEVIIKAHKMSEIKKKFQKKNQVATKQSHTYQEKETEKEKETEAEENKTTAAVNISHDDIIEINNSVFNEYQFSHGYPRDLFDIFAREAWPIYASNDNPNKKWKRFLAAYIKNAAPQIRDAILEKSKVEKPISAYMAEFFPQEEVNV